MAREAADQFDSVLLSNRVNEQVGGAFDSEHDLTRVVALAEDCYDLSNVRGGVTGDDELAGAAFDAAEALNGQIDMVRNEDVARACATVVMESDDWGDAWDADEIEAAQSEAREWLENHPLTAERVGFAVEVEA